MQNAATAAQIKELDRIAIEGLGIPSLNLMEAAAKAVAEEVLALLPRRPAATACVYGQVDGEAPACEQPIVQRDRVRTAVFCGPGNNGGDGVAAARLLIEKGVEVRAFLVGDRAKMTPDARAMEEKLTAVGGRLEPFAPDKKEQRDWIEGCEAAVDAVLGVGLSRPVAGAFLEAIRLMNRLRGPFCKIISCDVPSGVNADTGEIMGEAVRADVTVSFTCAKPGLYVGEGGPCAGRVEVASIGIPAQLIREQIENQPSAVAVLNRGKYILPKRKATAHKGEFGRILILAGSEGYTGAPALAASAAVRSGAGLVFLGVPREIYPIVAVKCEEAMPFPLGSYEGVLEKAQSCDAVLIGPGLGRAPETEQLVLNLLRDLNRPVVLDADGINALSGHIDVLDGRTAPTVLTPHDGEFQRLTDCVLPIRDRLRAACDFAKAHRCVLVLKGHGTITANQNGRAYLNGTGNPGMAKGGSGDVLAGLLVSLLGQRQLGGDPAELAALGVYYHGQAGDRCAERLGEYGMTPSDMVAELPLVLKEHVNQF